MYGEEPYVYEVYAAELCVCKAGSERPLARAIRVRYILINLYDQEQEEAVLLSNSLGLYETSKLEQETNQETDHYDPGLFKHGKLIISKVFLGQSVQAQELLPINPANYPDAISVFRPLRVSGSTPCSVEDESCSSKDHESCDCNLRRCEWFVFDTEMVVPEYFVEYEYISQEMYEVTCSLSSVTAGEFSDEMKLDEEVISIEPVIKPRPKIITLDEGTILSVGKANTYSQITVSIAKLSGQDMEG
ncbi:unnamed protein product [Ranitomeya imitator]|uniref:Uncharacterized protein n=1 Tax=Ranitomeya imitator TaxID=111125 RepID=A0ABN9M061_9NEOB|nr:unnamed protein product [Ranitomeya imitator]